MALLKVQTDIMTSLENGSVSILLMLDLSAAFDTIDHDVLISRLEKTYGITGMALAGFRSYSSDRYQSVMINTERSPDQLLDFSVPQGSVLGPKAYCMYSKPVGDIIIVTLMTLMGT